MSLARSAYQWVAEPMFRERWCVSACRLAAAFPFAGLVRQGNTSVPRRSGVAQGNMIWRYGGPSGRSFKLRRFRPISPVGWIKAYTALRYFLLATLPLIPPPRVPADTPSEFWMLSAPPRLGIREGYPTRAGRCRLGWEVRHCRRQSNSLIPPPPTGKLKADQQGAPRQCLWLEGKC